MTSKKKWVAGLLPALLLVAGTGQAEAKSLQGFPCQIDLSSQTPSGEYEIDPNQVLINTPELEDQFRTSFSAYRSQRVCQGKKGKVRLNCDALIDNWSLGKLRASGFSCQINTNPCDGGGLVEADEATLKIIQTRSSRCSPGSTSCGFANIECRRR